MGQQLLTTNETPAITELSFITSASMELHCHQGLSPVRDGLSRQLLNINSTYLSGDIIHAKITILYTNIAGTFQVHINQVLANMPEQGELTRNPF